MKFKALTSSFAAGKENQGLSNKANDPCSNTPYQSTFAAKNQNQIPSHSSATHLRPPRQFHHRDTTSSQTFAPYSALPVASWGPIPAAAEPHTAHPGYRHNGELRTISSLKKSEGHRQPIPHKNSYSKSQH